eukprot:365370-Chlamydomonas_euryale.AAC.3
MITALKQKLGAFGWAETLHRDRPRAFTLPEQEVWKCGGGLSLPRTNKALRCCTCQGALGSSTLQPTRGDGGEGVREADGRQWMKP